MAQQIQPQFIQMPKQQDDWLSSVFGLASAIPGVGPWVSGLLGLDSLFGGKKEEPKPIVQDTQKIGENMPDTPYNIFPNPQEDSEFLAAIFKAALGRFA